MALWLHNVSKTVVYIGQLSHSLVHFIVCIEDTVIEHVF